MKITLGDLEIKGAGSYELSTGDFFADKRGVQLKNGARCLFNWGNISGLGTIESFGYAYPESKMFPICMVDFDDKELMNGAQMSTDCVEIIDYDAEVKP